MKNFFVLLGVSLVLSACGFEPLNKPLSSGDQALPIEIQTEESFRGLFLRKELESLLLNPQEKRYKLVISLKSEQRKIGFRRDRAAVSRLRRLTATYRVYDGKKVLLSGVARSSSVVAHVPSIPGADFGVQTVREKAEQRGVEDLAIQINRHLQTQRALFLTNP